MTKKKDDNCIATSLRLMRKIDELEAKVRCIQERMESDWNFPERSKECYDEIR